MKYSGTIALTLLLAFLPAWGAQRKPEMARPQPRTDSQKKDTQKDEAQEPTEQDAPIRLGAQLVNVPFSVNDKTNKYINDLAKGDVEVFEDNKPQQIFSFERQTDIPITIAMLIDISVSQEYTLPYEITAGQRFFERVLRPKRDLGAVVTFEGESVMMQGLTSDVDKLRSALEDIRISLPSAAVGTITSTPPINSGSRMGSTAMNDSIYTVSSDLLSREAGRRVIILITDGRDTSSRVKIKEAIERTWRNEILVYTIGIGDRAYGGVNSGVLKKIAAETGGRAFFPKREDDLDRAFAQIDEDLRSQYVLSYEPANEARDGSFRTIQVRVKNRKDLLVRHRRGYFAPQPES